MAKFRQPRDFDRVRSLDRYLKLWGRMRDACEQKLQMAWLSSCTDEADHIVHIAMTQHWCDAIKERFLRWYTRSQGDAMDTLTTR